MIATFTVPGDSVPKARARTIRASNGKVMTYTPKETRTWEAWVRSCALAAEVPYVDDGPVHLTITFTRAWPKAIGPKSKRRATAEPATRPDIDNLAKGVKDALNGIAWRDDGQVTREVLIKVYGDQPRTDVTIESGEPLA